MLEEEIDISIHVIFKERNQSLTKYMYVCTFLKGIVEIEALFLLAKGMP